MEIIVNSKSKSVPNDLTLTGLIAMLELGGQRFAIEVNQRVIPRTEHANYALQANDKIEIVRAIGGG
ncbi:MAG: sulfur carrier protein ThiS [Gammaproteobacteria bacterium]|nr:sulfur carrier protein ThiS [Gammaproteobacteria bacterium]